MLDSLIEKLERQANIEADSLAFLRLSRDQLKDLFITLDTRMHGDHKIFKCRFKNKKGPHPFMVGIYNENEYVCWINNGKLNGPPEEEYCNISDVLERLKEYFYGSATD